MMQKTSSANVALAYMPPSKSMPCNSEGMVQKIRNHSRSILFHHEPRLLERGIIYCSHALALTIHAQEEPPISNHIQIIAHAIQPNAQQLLSVLLTLFEPIGRSLDGIAVCEGTF